RLVRLQEIAAVEHDRINLLRRHELDNLDLFAALFWQRFQVVFGQDHRRFTLRVGPVDVGVLDHFSTHLAAAFVTNPSAIGVMYLVQADVMVLGRGVELDRHIYQAKGDGSLPDRSHAWTTTHSDHTESVQTHFRTQIDQSILAL